MKTVHKLLTVLLLITLSPALLAEDIRYYDVEVILFENLDRKARESENWPSSVELELPENAVEVGKPAALPLPEGYEPTLSFTPLMAKEYRLNNQAAKIEESKSRRVLLHTGWVQPGLPLEMAVPVYFKRDIPAPNTATETSSLENDTPPPPSRYVQPEAGELEGLIKVILARYLHVDTEIVFRPEEKQDEFSFDYQQVPALNEPQPLPLEPDMQSTEQETDGVEIEEEQPVVYLMNQTRRRMRSRELHYLDNPVIGMLIMITPHEKQVAQKTP